jgi:hypothetical protein
MQRVPLPRRGHRYGSRALLAPYALGFCSLLQTISSPPGALSTTNRNTLHDATLRSPVHPGSMPLEDDEEAEAGSGDLPRVPWGRPSCTYVESETRCSWGDGRERRGAPGLLTPIVHARDYTPITAWQELGNKTLPGRSSTGYRLFGMASAWTIRRGAFYPSLLTANSAIVGSTSLSKSA